MSPAWWGLGQVLPAVCGVAMLLMVVQHLGGLSLPGCRPAGPCARAAASRWGAVGGWPVSFLGLAYFAGLTAAWTLLGRGGVPRPLRYVIRAGAAVSAGFVVLGVQEG